MIIMTVKELLQLKSMTTSHIVTDGFHKQLDILGVNVMEVPDIINWVKKGEFLMTAGYSYRNKPDEFAALIPHLAQKEIAALGIKVHRYFDKIPAAIIENANQAGLAVIEIAEDVTFSNVVREVIETLMAGEYNLVAGMMDKIKVLSELILSGKGLELFADKLSEYVNNPIVIRRENGESICVGLGSEDAYITNRENALMLEDNDEKQGLTTIMVGVRQYKAFFYNIFQNNNQVAKLYIIEKRKELDNSDMHLVEQCSFMIGMELQSESVRTQVEMKYIDQFLQNWVQGRIESEGDFSTQSETCKVSINIKNNYNVCIIDTVDVKIQLQRCKKNLRMYSNLYFTIIDNQLIAIFQDSKETEYIQLIQEITNSSRMCIGKASDRYYNLLESYKDAENILLVSRRYKINKRILHYKDTGVYSLLYLIPVGAEVDGYMNPYLRPLLEYDEKHQTDMYETLKVYLDNKGNVKATAKLYPR